MAWRLLVDGHAGLVWSVVRGFRFDDDTAQDVFQTVWLRLAEHLDRIREPAKLAGWLGQTTRNECVGIVRQRSRTIPSEEVIDLGDPIDLTTSRFPEPGELMERDEQRVAIAAAYERLPDRCRRLLAMLISDPPVSYEEISRLLEIPIGSIGPTRSRCLSTLRSSPEVSRITGGARPS